MINLDISASGMLDEAVGVIKKSTQTITTLVSNKLKTKSDCDAFFTTLVNDINAVSNAHSKYAFMQYYSSDMAVIHNSKKIDQMFSEYSDIQNNNNALYLKIREYLKQTKNNLSPDKAFFIDKIITTFINSGIALDNETKLKLQKTNKQITSLETKIQTKNKDIIMQFTRENLVGLPESYINELTVVSRSPIRYAIKMTKAHYNFCMKYISDEFVRQKIEYEYSNVHTASINDIMTLIKLRHKKAHLLSYKTYADYKLVDNTLRSPKQIADFLCELMNKVDYRFYREVTTMLKLKNNKNINTWDIQYYTTKWKHSYGIHDNEIKEYFQVSHTLDSIVRIYETIFNIQITKQKNQYVIMENDNVIGYLLVNLTNKNSKSIQTYVIQHACNDTLPQLAILANYPDLLHYQDVLSLFHEFAHVLHAVFGKTDYVVFSGINVEEDFVEAPALFMELCCIEYYLKNISCHYKTGKKIEDRIIDKIKKIKGIDIGINYKRHILLAHYDLLLHGNEEFVNAIKQIPDNASLKALMSKTFKTLADDYLKYEGYQDNKYKILLNNHLIFPTEIIDIVVNKPGLYYSGLWSKVIASEMYYVEKNNKNKYENFRTNVLNNGGLRSSKKMIHKMVNKSTSFDGFLNVYNVDDDMSVFAVVGDERPSYEDNKFSEVRESELGEHYG